MEQVISYFTDANAVQIYFIIFGLLIAGAFGFPCPEELVFLSVGYSAYMGWTDPFIGAAVGFSAVVAGDTIIYFLGKKLGLKIFSLPVLRKVITKRAIQKGHSLLDKHGSKFVFFSKFVVGLRYSVFFASGMMNIGYRRFITFDILASLITIPVLITLALNNGHRIDLVVEAVKHVYNWILISALTGITVFITVNKIKSRKK